MKKAYIFILALCISSTAFAHPPKKINVSYNKDIKELDVEIKHPVYDPKTHYTKRVVISKNGKEIISDNFEEQENKSGHKLKYVIRNLEKGDRITVKALCNVYGNTEESIIVKE